MLCFISIMNMAGQRRRDFLKLAGVTALSAVIPGCFQAGIEKGHTNGRQGCFFFVQMADPQLFWGPLKEWETAIEHINRLRPAFAIVCGDLINRNGNVEKTDTQTDEKMARAYHKAAEKLDRGISLYNVAGNHDVCNQPTPETLGWYEARFGKLWYSFTYQRYLFIVLESDILKYPQNAPAAAEWQMAWLKETLRRASGREFFHTMVFMHHPMCLKSVDEDDNYFNMPRAIRSQLLGLFHKYGVRAVFSGHYHRNRYVRDGQIELVTTSSSGIGLPEAHPEAPLGFRIVKVRPGCIEHKYYGYNDMPRMDEIMAG